MKSINRQVHFYGDSHTAGYETNHDQILGRNTFREKKDLIHQMGLHQAITMWNRKMSRATKLPVFDFTRAVTDHAYPKLFDPTARIKAWPAMSADYLHLQIREDSNNNVLNKYEHVFIGIPRPTRVFELDYLGHYDFKNEDLDGNAQAHTDAHYACTWALHMAAIKDFLDKNHISYFFIKHFDIMDDTIEDIHHFDVPSEAQYFQLIFDTYKDIHLQSIPKRLDQFGDALGFHHRDAEGHKQFAAYLKNYLT